MTSSSLPERLKATERIIRNIFRLRHLMRMVWLAFLQLGLQEMMIKKYNLDLV